MKSPQRKATTPPALLVTAAFRRLVGNKQALALATDRLHEAMARADGIPFEGADLVMNEFHLERGWYYRGDSFREHSHSLLQVEIILHGEFIFQGQGESYTLRPSDALVIPPKVKHAWRATKDSLMLGILLQPTINHSALQGALPVADKLISLTSWNQSQDLAELLKLLTRPWTRGNMLRVRLAMTRVIADIVQAAYPESDQEVEDAKHTRAKRAVNQVATFIQDNINKHLSLPELETNSGMSSRNLNRLFQKELGVSLHQYILLARLQKAKSLLEAFPDRQIKEVAYECGFSSPGHLSTSMKKHLKVSPNHLRS